MRTLRLLVTTTYPVVPINYPVLGWWDNTYVIPCNSDGCSEDQAMADIISAAPFATGLRAAAEEDRSEYRDGERHASHA